MKRRQERNSLDILEEAVSLLRAAPASAVVTYLAGAIPLQLGLLFFLSDMTRGAYAFDHLPLASLALAGLYVWKNCWQAEFMARLFELVSVAENRAKSRWRMIVVQGALQPLSLLAPLPISWIVMFFRYAALFAALGRADIVRTASKQASRARRQDWAVLAMVTLAGLFLFVNVGITILILPQLAKSFLGIEGELARSARALFNLTTIGVALSITWLAIDPLLDAVCVLRCFYDESIATGEDLRAAFQRTIRKPVVAIAILAAFIAIAPPSIRAQQQQAETHREQSIDTVKLNKAIDDVMHHGEFAWRHEQPHGEAPQWYRRVMQSLDDAWQWAKKTLLDWLIPAQERGSRGTDSPVKKRTMQALIALIVALIAGGVVVFFMRRQRAPIVAAQAVTAATPAINLADESVTADQLPESSWLALAEEWLAKGDCRLALRALYLAGLNYLATRELISLCRWKSGLDYRREVERRSRAQAKLAPEFAPAFTRSIAIFEQGWYGRHADRELVESLAAQLQEMRSYARS